jgi:hypothetical protein
MIYGCYFYNMCHTHWFDSEEEAKAYGEKSGFQYTIVYSVVEKIVLGYN